MDEDEPLSRRAARQLEADSDEGENLFDDTETMQCDLSLGPGDEAELNLQDAGFLSQSGSTSFAVQLTHHKDDHGTEPKRARLATQKAAPGELLPIDLTEGVQESQDDSKYIECRIPRLDVSATQESSSIDLPAVEDTPIILIDEIQQHPVIQETPEVEETSFGADYFWNYVCDGDESTSMQGFSVLEGLQEGAESDEEEAPHEVPIDSSMETPLYHGASITVGESLASLLALAQSEHLSGVGIGRLLSFVDLHLPQPNNFLKTNHSVFKLFDNLNEPVEIHHFCSICYKTRKSVSDLCDFCTDETRTVEFFITFPLAPQLRRLFQRPDFVQNLRYNQVRVKSNENNIEDIFDGHVYRAAESQGRTSNGITFMWNTDGVPVFKSNTFSLWPFYLVTVELPPNKRFLTENLLIAGIWGSTVKPHPNVYLLPIYKQLEILKKGIDVNCYGESEIQNVKCSVLCGTCDAPATAAFLI